MSDKKLCFVLMPFKKDYDDYFIEIYKPAIELAGLEAKRADDLFRPSTIIRDVWEFILKSSIVIADISGLNPNVMYELGLAHAIAKPAIIISDNIENVPFDLRSLRILLYETTQPSWGSTLKSSVEKSIKETLEAPLESVLPAFFNIRPAKQEDISEVKSDLIEIKQLLYRELDSTYETKTNKVKSILTADGYAEAAKDAYQLYYEDGLEVSAIKKFLMDKYNISTHTASDILFRA